MLIMKHRGPRSLTAISDHDSQASSLQQSNPGESSAVFGNTPSDSPRVHWNTILARATAKHPKSRRLSMGGYVSPQLGTRGAEMTGNDVLSPESDLTGLSATVGPCKRVNLSGAVGETGSPEAICLMCRAGVKGWLRVYAN